MPTHFSANAQVLLALFLALTCCALAIPVVNLSTSVSSGKVGSLDAIIPHCFFPGSHHLLGPTNLADCKNALRTLIQQPGFKDSYRFSRNPRNGVQVPRGWRAGNCLILLSCENDFDADTFSYVDVLRKAKFVVDQCVDLAEGEVPYGGLDKIGSVGSFYVSVNGRMDDSEGAHFLESMNTTLEA